MRIRLLVNMLTDEILGFGEVYDVAAQKSKSCSMLTECIADRNSNYECIRQMWLQHMQSKKLLRMNPVVRISQIMMALFQHPGITWGKIP